MPEKYDFSGWATRFNVLCSDGRVIDKGAFANCDGKKVPIVWNHRHDGPENVIGHALLECRESGVYMYGKLNDTRKGSDAKILLSHGDISSVSIFANQLKQIGSHVSHGIIREVSLVLAGANPGAYIETLAIEHSEDSDNESALIYTDEEDSELSEIIEHSEEESSKQEETIEHADEPEASQDDNKNQNDEKEPEKMAEKETKSKADMTVEEFLNTLSEEDRTIVEGLVGAAIEQTKEELSKGDNKMKHNCFDSETEKNEENVLTHSDIVEIFADAKRIGSMKEAFLQHGITNIDFLFPEATAIAKEPDLIKREDGWVSVFMNAAHKTPFSRVKSLHANITGADARARGYVKGNLKTDEVIALLKRVTTPCTIYKKQSIDRDDEIDINDMAVVAWLKREMRMMLDEEIARAALVTDGRSASSNDKISETNIRPIWTDDDLYTVKFPVTISGTVTDTLKAKALIRACVKSRKQYKGTGKPILFTTEDMLTECLLLEDVNGRVIYDSEEKLATAMRVAKIATVPVMENLSRIVGSNTHDLMGIIVNPIDYNFGADKGGAVNMFDDFDIDYNKQKYLMETRCSGALVKPYSAIAIEHVYETPSPEPGNQEDVEPEDED